MGIFEVRVVVGTGMKFEISSRDGVLSRDHEEVNLE